jgi:pimeloyl-ACP methyl ester carboxylesterase
MPSPTLQALKYLRSWSSQQGDFLEEELTLDRGFDRVPATLFLPPGRSGALPGWVVLHGITRPGRAHPSLLRFCRALTSTGAAVLLPEIPEWRELQLAPDRAVPTIRAAILALDARPETQAGRTGAVGFSFGAPQVLIAARDPALRGHLSTVVGFGGYCHLRETLRFQFTGEFQDGDTTRRLRPDPYGRWVVGANYLTTVPGLEGAGDVTRALHSLATAAGERRIESWSPLYDPIKAELRAGIAPERRELFDLFAPAGDREPDLPRSLELVEALCSAAEATDPLLDPTRWMAEVQVPVHLVHGRQDHLIPFTETLRLKEALPTGKTRTTITGLFAHSEGTRVGSALHGAAEGIHFLRALRAILADV